MTTYREPQYVLDARQARAAARPPQPCGEGVGRGLACGAHPARPYPRGWRCDSHAPDFAGDRVATA